jgi:hypothetical protein
MGTLIRSEMGYQCEVMFYVEHCFKSLHGIGFWPCTAFSKKHALNEKFSNQKSGGLHRKQQSKNNYI